ncbi:MAG: cadherin-like beta sandwich domain-containing protein, partial [Fibrobacter sp.]|nr:cadherin-like beta sandwich domain-containing protein [Fibrobacter sp.]
MASQDSWFKWGWKHKERFKVFSWRDGQLVQECEKERINLGEKVQKAYDIGNSFIVASKYKNKKEKWQNELAVNSLTYNGINWEKQAIYSENIGAEVKEPQPYAFGNSFLIKKNAANSKDLLFFKKFQQSFKNEPIFTYVVTEKEMFDGLNEISSTTTYEYDNTKGTYYNLTEGTAEFEHVTVKAPDGGATKFTFMCGPSKTLSDGTRDFSNRIFEGMIKEKSIKNAKDKTISRDKITYDYIDNSVMTDWPQDLIYRYTKKTESTYLGLSSSVESNICSTTGEISKTIEQTKNKKRITEKYYAPDIKNSETTVYSTMVEYNIVSVPLQTTIYENSTDKINAVSSMVTTWQLEGNVPVPYESYAWKVNKSKANSPGYENFDFYSIVGNSNYDKLETITSRTSWGGVDEVMKSTIKSCTFLGPNGAFPVATIENAGKNECAYLSGDYDENATIDSKNYLDAEQGWENGGVEVLKPSKKHFRDFAIKIENTDYVAKTMNSDYLHGNYVFSFWCYVDPASTTKKIKINVLKGTGNEDIQNTIKDYEVPTGKWTFVKRVISEKELNALTGIHSVLLKITGTQGLKAFIEEIRFYPEKSKPQSIVYDNFWKTKIASIDANNNSSDFIENDIFGIAKRVFKRDETGKETTVKSIEQNYMSCCNDDVDKDLKLVSVNGKEVINNNGNYELFISNNSNVANLYALAKNNNTTVSINGNINENYYASDVLSINDGRNGPYTISVIQPDGDLSDPTS